jgi:tetratricopeptide (TPR) repeat protein
MIRFRIPCGLIFILIPVLTFATHERNKVWQDEESLWRDAVTKSPGKARPHNNLASALGSVGRWQEALEEAEQAALLAPDEWDGWGTLGWTHYGLGRFDLAVVNLKRALAIDSTQSAVHLWLAKAYEAQGEKDEAIEEYSIHIDLKPLVKGPYTVLGSLLEEKGEYDKMVHLYQFGIKNDPRFAEAYYYLGNTYRQLGRPLEAIAQFQNAIEIDPGLMDAHYNLAHSYQLQGQDEEALEIYENIIEIDPSYHRAHINLGAIHLQHQEIEKSTAAFQRVLELDPLNLIAHFNLGMIHYQNKDFSDSIYHFDRAVREGAQVPSKLMRELAPYRKYESD